MKPLPFGNFFETIAVLMPLGSYFARHQNHLKEQYYQNLKVIEKSNCSMHNLPFTCRSAQVQNTFQILYFWLNFVQ